MLKKVDEAEMNENGNINLRAMQQQKWNEIDRI